MMSSVLQITASHPYQRAVFEGSASLPVQLWAICDEGEETTCLAGLVFDPETRKMTRADYLPNFQYYRDDRSQNGISRQATHHPQRARL